MADGENVKYMQIKVFSVFNLLYAVSLNYKYFRCRYIKCGHKS